MLATRDAEVVRACQNDARGISAAIMAFIAISFVASDYVGRATLAIIGLVASVILGIEILATLCSVHLAKQGSNRYSRATALAGILFIVGGIWFDVCVTIFYSPDLQRERNPLVVSFLSQNVPLWGIILFAFVAQGLLTVLSCVLWVAFLKHADIYLSAILAMRPRSLLGFLFASIGFSTQYARFSEVRISSAYRFFWIPAIGIINPLGRWLVGFEWLGIIPVRSATHILVSFGSELPVVAAFLVWFLHRYYKSQKAVPSS